MSYTPPTNSPTDLDKTRVQQVATQFAEAWKARGAASEEVYLSAFLPPAEDRLRVLMLHQLLPTDLAFRWHRGEKPLLESYLESFPELGSASDLPVELICDEFRIRTRHGDTPKLEGYQKRFPKQFSGLRALINQTLNASTTHPLFDTPLPAPETPRAELRSPENRKVVTGGEGYELLECIGHGAFADVWKAEAPGGIEVAVKIIRWTASNKLSQVELRALELIKRLRHAFLLQVQAYWLSEGQLYIVMDLADGTLQHRMEACQREGLPGIPTRELLSYLREVAEALDFLHANQVLHRDIKPANIMLASGHAKLADFGLARLVIEKGTDIRATTTGTPLYMSPEVWGNKVGPESDQYSLASTYVELRLGRPLFPAETYTDVMLDHLNTRPKLDELPVHEQRVLHKALSKQIENRYANCLEFVAALEEAVELDTNPPKSYTRRYVLAAFAFLLLAAGLGFAARQWWPWHTRELSAPSQLQVVAGDEATFELHLLGGGDLHNVQPVFIGVPAGVQLSATSVNDVSVDSHVWRVQVRCDLNSPDAVLEQPHALSVTVGEGDDRLVNAIQLTLKWPVMVMPPGCSPAPQATRVHVESEKKNYWNRIVRRLPGESTPADAKRCELVLVPYESAGVRVPSFYIMENKVWNQLFATFNQQHLQAHPDQAGTPQWPDDWQRLGASKGADDLPADAAPLNPVMRVGYPQAQQFAAWLGGKLPTCEQWDTAAGFYLPLAAQRQGPFQGEWKEAPEDRPEIAVDRVEEGPLPVGSARDDVSPYGVRDMSGNGAEWTRNASSGTFSTIKLRGRRYDKHSPLYYDHLREEKQQNEIDSEDPEATSPFVGFRIVIEP